MSVGIVLKLILLATMLASSAGLITNSASIQDSETTTCATREDCKNHPFGYTWCIHGRCRPDPTATTSVK